MYICVCCMWWRYLCHMYVVEISLPYTYHKLIPPNRNWRHIAAFHWYCRLARLRYTAHVARMGENRIPNLILDGEILEACRKQGRPNKSFREGLKKDLHKFDIWGKCSRQNTFQEFVADRDKWRKMINTQAQIFQKNWGKNKVEKSNTRKEKTKYKILLLYVLPIIAYTWLKDKILL